MKTKICTTCNKELEATTDNYHKMVNGKHGLRSTCRPCTSVYNKKIRSTPEAKKRAAKAMVKWRKENPEKAKAICDKNRKLHGEKHNKKRRIKYANDPEFRRKIAERELRYKASGRRYAVNNTPEQRDKSIKRSRKLRDNLSPCYVAQQLGISVDELTPEIFETKKLIITLKREIGITNIKTR